MVAALPGRAAKSGERGPLGLPDGTDGLVIASLVLGFLALYLPSYVTLAQKVWSTDEQGHGPIILALSFYLLYAKRFDLQAVAGRPARYSGAVLLALGCGMYVLGRSQFVMVFEVFSQIVVLAALLLLFLGWSALRIAWFPLFFMLFMVPLPGSLVAAVTGPLKAAVSAIASALLYRADYPIGRSGVTLTIGPYQLLVADACAGLNSMFTLEALGLLYMHLMRYTGVVRNVALAVLIVPISFVANVVRVVILVIVTFYFGDEAGQGFVHGFAGIVLFLVGLTMMLACDKLLRLASPTQQKG